MNRYPTIFSHTGGSCNVEVDLIDDDGNAAVVTVMGAESVDSASALAADWLNDNEAFGSQSWTMNETRAA